MAYIPKQATLSDVAQRLHHEPAPIRSYRGTLWKIFQPWPKKRVEGNFGDILVGYNVPIA